MLKRVCLLMAMIWSLGFICTADAAPMELGLKPVVLGNEYSISLFMDDKVLRNPNAALTGFLEIKPGMKLSVAPVLDLWYSYSPTILPDISTMTVSVNGIPAESRRLVPDGAFRSNWQVALPLTSLREGINEITISVLHRSIEGLCKDIDNDANWFIIRPETTIKFKVDAMNYSLATGIMLLFLLLISMIIILYRCCGCRRLWDECRVMVRRWFGKRGWNSQMQCLIQML